MMIDQCSQAQRTHQPWAERCVFVSKEWMMADHGGVLFAQSVKKWHLAEVSLGVPLELEVAVARSTVWCSGQDDSSVFVDRERALMWELCRRDTLRSAADLL